MKAKKISILVFLTIVLFLVGFRLFTGYYPLTDLVYKLYYANLNDEEPLDAVEIDGDFKFYEKGYFISQEVSSPYPLSHFLILRFESDIAPMEIETTISVKLEIFREGKQVYSTITKKVKKLFERDAKGLQLGVNGIGLAELPFPLKRKTYEDITIEITVLEAAENLHEYVDKGSLLLFPNIQL